MFLAYPGGYGVYLTEELEAIASVLRRHDREFAYYCASHTNTRRLINLAILRARGTL